MVSYTQLIAPERLLQAWEAFLPGKRGKKDVQEYARDLEDNIFTLHRALAAKTWQHGSYESFWVHDPKRRHIHKASVANRVIHHLLYTYLYELFDKIFIHDSYSCRLGKGTHKAVRRLVVFVQRESQNYTRPCCVLHCDVKTFFASADHEILKALLVRRVEDEDILRLLFSVIDSFHSDEGVGQGIPLGNLTSQVFANIYLHALDIFVKHRLRVESYIRYADDFVFVSSRKEELESYIAPLGQFLHQTLKLTLHPRKVEIRRLDWGIDFLGYIVLPHYLLPRTKTKRRLLRKIREGLRGEQSHQMIQSYLGYLSHANAYKLQTLIRNVSHRREG